MRLLDNFEDWRKELETLRDKTPQYKYLSNEIKDVIYCARYENPHNVVRFKPLSDFIAKKFGVSIQVGTLKDWATRIQDERGMK